MHFKSPTASTAIYSNSPSDEQSSAPKQWIKISTQQIAVNRAVYVYGVNKKEMVDTLSFTFCFYIYSSGRQSKINY